MSRRLVPVVLFLVAAVALVAASSTLPEASATTPAGIAGQQTGRYDAARPFVSQDLIGRVIEGLHRLLVGRFAPRLPEMSKTVRPPLGEAVVCRHLPQGCAQLARRGAGLHGVPIRRRQRAAGGCQSRGQRSPR